MKTDDDVPLAEAAYLGRNSSETLSWARFDPAFVDVDFDSQQLAFDLYVRKSMFFLAGGVTHVETAFVNSTGTFMDHDTDWFGVAGIIPYDGPRITTFYSHNQGYDPNVAVKYVGKLGSSRFYGFGVQAVDPDEGDLDLSGDFDFFFDAALSVGVAYDEGDKR